MSKTLFSFKYGGRSSSLLDFKTETHLTDNGVTKVCALEDGLTVTNAVTFHGDALEWVNYLENRGNEPTEIISELYDADVALPYAGRKTNRKSLFLQEKISKQHTKKSLFFPKKQALL